MRRIAMGFIIAVCSVICPAAGFSQKSPDLTKSAGKEWLTVGGDWHNTRYSTLTQINRNNVKNLTGAWVTHLGSGLGQKYSFEGTPIVKDGILYIATGNDDVFALDGKTGALIWEHRSGIEQNISTVCCGWDNRGVAVGDGKVFLGQLDGFSRPRHQDRQGGLEPSSPAGRMATPSPPRRCSTTAWSIPAFPAEIGVSLDWSRLRSL